MSGSRKKSHNASEMPPYNKKAFIQNLKFLSQSDALDYRTELKKAVDSRVKFEELYPEKYSMLRNVRLITGCIEDLQKVKDPQIRYIILNTLENAFKEDCAFDEFALKDKKENLDYFFKLFPPVSKPTTFSEISKYYQSHLNNNFSKHRQEIAINFFTNLIENSDHRKLRIKAAVILTNYYRDINNINKARQYAETAAKLNKKYQILVDDLPRRSLCPCPRF